MAIIQNSAVMQKLIDELGLSPALEKIPTELADKILPTFQVNSDTVIVQSPTATIIREANNQAGGTTTIYTTPATGKFFLSNVSLSLSAKAGSTQICDVSVFIDGVSRKILYMVNTPITAGDTPVSPCLALNLQNPVLVDAGTIISVTSSGASCDAFASIVGYTTD